MKRYFFLLLLCLIGLSVTARRNIEPVADELLTVFSSNTDSTGVERILYRETLCHSEKSDSAALVVYLHGAGSRGDDNIAPLGMPVIQDIYSYLIENDIKAYFLVPQCPETASWSGVAPENGRPRGDGSRPRGPLFRERGKQLNDKTPFVHCLMPMLEKYVREHDINPRRIYILGASMGAAGVWELIAANPTFFAAGMAASGGYRGKVTTGLISTPILCSAGTEENSYSKNKKMVDSLKSHGAYIVFVSLDGLDHIQACNKAFTTDNLNWLFSKKR